MNSTRVRRTALHGGIRMLALIATLFVMITSGASADDQTDKASVTPRLSSRSPVREIEDFDPFEIRYSRGAISETAQRQDGNRSRPEEISPPSPRGHSSHRTLAGPGFADGPSFGPLGGYENWLDQPIWTPGPGCVDCEFAGAVDSDWAWRLFPRDLIFKSYLAGVKESRISTVWFDDDELGRQWDSTLGARVGLLRFGTGDDFPFYTQGWQLDVEGAAAPRLDLVDGRRDLVASDFRIGVPITYGHGRYQAKFAYYHLSAHLGDEFLLRTGATRINFVRDVLVWGHSYFVNDWLRTYGEVGYGLHTDGGSEPWEFQFGFDVAPPCPTGFHGAPFVAMNAHLREEFDFGGHFVAQAGWAWRARRGGPLARIGLHYLNGKSSQWELFDQFEEQIGFGMWYDF